MCVECDQEIKKNIMGSSKLTPAETAEWEGFFANIPDTIADMKPEQLFVWPIAQLKAARESICAHNAVHGTTPT